MKRYLPFLVLLLYSCSTPNSLNKAIYKSQKQSLQISPFESAERAKGNCKTQKTSRTGYIKDLWEIYHCNPGDTIILVEVFDEICINCPADYANIYIDSLCYRYEKFFADTVVEEGHATAFLNPGYVESKRETPEYIDLFRKEISKDPNWHGSPQDFSDENCFGGSLSFYTVLYPLGQIKSIYVRCWTFDLNIGSLDTKKQYP
jgi:hypothetical protein